MLPSGAYGVNREFEFEDINFWYVEEQRRGMEAITAGLLKEDTLAFEAGLRMLDWGFSRQAADGSFPGTGDAFHSTSLFLYAAARSLFLIEQSGLEEFQQIAEGRTAEYPVHIRAGMEWLTSSGVWEEGLLDNSSYTHRHYILAIALGLASKLLDEPLFKELSFQQIQQGLERQLPNGVNPERDGYDSSYQMAGVLFAGQWLSYFPNVSIASPVKEMIEKAIDWELTRISEEGVISSNGNTRTGRGQEITRSGEIKAINHREVMEAFAYCSGLLRDRDLIEPAIQMASYYYSRDSSVMESLSYFL